MGFVADFNKVSAVRGGLLVFLLITGNLSPEYKWPADYLTRYATNCKPQIKWFGIIPMLNGFTCDNNACERSVSNTLPTFDYIIVGSGVAGSTLAYRLALADSSRNVLLIEDGGDPVANSISPRLFPFNLNNTATYKYYAEKSPNYSVGFGNGTNNNCGNSVGGTSQINAMMYVCGTDKDYNDWAESTGDSSWNYQNMLPYIIKHQNMKDTTLTSGTCAPYHGTQGRVRITDAGFDTDPIVSPLRMAAAELNYNELVDINCGPQVGWNGFVNIRMTINDGQRESSARAFLTPLKDLKNFFLMKNSFVDKVLVTKDAGGNVLVSGVNVVTKISKCKNIQLTATREVILSAGALSTPKILLNSGIGRTADLQPCNTPQMLDLNVGNNLIDHPASLHFWTIPGDPKLTSLKYNGQLLISALQYLVTNKNSYFENLGAVNYGGFINTTDRTSKYPDIQYIFYRAEQHMPEVDKTYREKFGLIPSIANKLIELNKDYSLIQVSNLLLLPKARGSVKLRACNPRANPLIDSGFFTDPYDMDTMVRGYKALRDLFNSNAMKTFGAQEVKLPIPECDVLQYGSDDYIRCYLKYMTGNEWHPCSTAKMGKISDPNAVVDTNLRVIGVKRGAIVNVRTNPMLRVVDASIMPMVMSGNIQCTVYAIAEKAAEVAFL